MKIKKKYEQILHILFLSYPIKNENFWKLKIFQHKYVFIRNNELHQLALKIIWYIYNIYDFI